MNRKRLILVVLAGLVLLVVLLISRIEFRPKSRINADTIKLIKVGMTREEVESILGNATGDCNSSRIIYLQTAPPYRPWNYKTEPVFWGSDEAQVRIHFDAAERAEGVYDDIRIETHVSIGGRVRWHLGL
jgi:hypothetical protein